MLDDRTRAEIRGVVSDLRALTRALARRSGDVDKGLSAAARTAENAAEASADLSAMVKRIERSAGRVRSGVRWSARTLDLDLLLFGDEVLRRPRLVVPHPGLVVRRFVLAPLAELCPDRVVPGTGRTVAQLLALLAPEDLSPAGLYPA